MDLLQVYESDDNSISSKEDDQQETAAPHASSSTQTQQSPTKTTQNSRKRPRVEVIDEVAAATIFQRSQPHVRGQWAGHIFIKLTTLDDNDSEVQRSVNSYCKMLEAQGSMGPCVKHSYLHVSLSKPFYLTLASIDSFVEALTDRLAIVQPFTLGITTRPFLLVNDEKTRSFCCWKVSNALLQELVHHVDHVLKRYQQPTYYDPPLFHTSLASAPTSLEQSSMTTSMHIDHVYRLSETVTSVHCTFGTTKEFVISLGGPDDSSIASSKG